MKHRSELQTLVKALKLFQTLDTEMQIPTMLTLLELAMWDDNEAPSVSALGKKIGTKTSATAGSRNVMAWCENNRTREKGYDMMETKENPTYRVEKLVSLKAKGYAFADALVDIMNNKKENDAN